MNIENYWGKRMLEEVSEGFGLIEFSGEILGKKKHTNDLSLKNSKVSNG